MLLCGFGNPIPRNLDCLPRGQEPIALDRLFHPWPWSASRNQAQRRIVDELLAMFGGRAKLVMAHLVESGELSLADVKAT
jgi:hypothetical protein